MRTSPAAPPPRRRPVACHSSNGREAGLPKEKDDYYLRRQPQEGGRLGQRLGAREHGLPAARMQRRRTQKEKEAPRPISIKEGAIYAGSFASNLTAIAHFDGKQLLSPQPRPARNMFAEDFTSIPEQAHWNWALRVKEKSMFWNLCRKCNLQVWNSSWHPQQV